MNEPNYDNTESIELPAFAFEQSQQPPKPMSITAIAGFVCAFLSPIPGLILSFIAHKQCQDRNEDGQGLATAGIIVSVLNLLLRLAILVFCIWIFVWTFSQTADLLSPPAMDWGDIFGGMDPGMIW